MKATLILSFLLSLSALADGPCKEDIEKYCKDVPKGGGAVMHCLKEHHDQLSPACKEKGEHMKEKMHAFKEACKADVEKFCKDVTGGHGAKLKCLHEHESELSSDCKEKLPKGRR